MTIQNTAEVKMARQEIKSAGPRSAAEIAPQTATKIRAKNNYDYQSHIKSFILVSDAVKQNTSERTHPITYTVDLILLKALIRSTEAKILHHKQIIRAPHIQGGLASYSQNELTFLKKQITTQYAVLAQTRGKIHMLAGRYHPNSLGRGLNDPHDWQDTLRTLIESQKDLAFCMTSNSVKPNPIIRISVPVNQMVAAKKVLPKPSLARQLFKKLTGMDFV